MIPIDNVNVVSDDLETKLRDAKLEAMAEFAAGAGHEINNPLATISGRVQLLLRTETDPQKRQALLTIGGQAYRIRDMIGDAMLFGRPPQPVCDQVGLVPLIQEVLKHISTQIEESGCQIQFESPSKTTVWGDAGQIKTIVSQLILNSLSASKSGQNILLECYPTVEQEKEFATFKITDWGCGISSTEAEHLFDPFYSGRQAGRGLGFGLSKCWQIARIHGGHIDYQSINNNGTCFTVTLPAQRGWLDNDNQTEIQVRQDH